MTARGWKWRDVEHETDDKGRLTSLARAARLLDQLGCECLDGDPPRSCIACVMERALRDLWRQRKALRKRLRGVIEVCPECKGTAWKKGIVGAPNIMCPRCCPPELDDSGIPAGYVRLPVLRGDQ